MSYTDVFSGSNIYPSNISYKSLSFSADTELDWPLETTTGSNVVAEIMDLVPSTSGLSLTMPDAREVTQGETVLFNNTGGDAVSIKDNGGTQITSISSGEIHQVYLTDNSDAAGTWNSFQYGSSATTANASSLVGEGLKAIGSSLNTAVPVTDFSSDFTLTSLDRAKMFLWTGTTGILTLPSALDAGDNWFCMFRNEGSGAVSVAAPGGDEIDSESSKSFQVYESAIIACDGTGFWTVGFGQDSEFSFDYTAIDVSGTGDYTLSGTELNRIAYRFTGTLTGNRDVIVPTTVQQYWVDNSTSGSYDFTIKVSGGTGVTLSSGSRAIFYCNGTDVVDADTSTVSTPISVANGGTGSTTASGARINLGGTSLGITLFTAANTATVWTALGESPGINGGTF